MKSQICRIYYLGTFLSLASFGMLWGTCPDEQHQEFKPEAVLEHLTEGCQATIGSSLGLNMLFVGLAIFGVSALFGKMAIEQAFQPLDELSKQAKELKDPLEWKACEMAPFQADPELGEIAARMDCLQTQVLDIQETVKRTLIGISHEVRNPLTVVSADLDLLSKDIPEDLREELVLEAQKAVTGISIMLKDLMLLMSTKAQVNKLNPMAVNVLSYLDEVVERYRTKNPGHTVIWVPSQQQSGNLTALLDEEKTERIIVDLLMNCFLYSDVNMAKVSVEHNSQKEVVISVSDQGRGIDEVHHEKLFEQFYRLESSRDRQSGGVGLGLPLARVLARAQGGDLLLTSELGRGTQIQIVLREA